MSKTIWHEAGKNSGQLAEALGLRSPTDAPSLWNLAHTLIQLTMGPEVHADIIESSAERLVARITSCPWMNRAREQEHDGTTCIAGDLAWNRGLAEYYGLDVTHEIPTAMPSGGEYCAHVIQIRG